jgi:glycosyltransferase involved in cell wall biosynthesis
MLAKAFGRKVLVFWRGWDNEACGMQEFPGGNSSWQSRAFRMADAHIVLASEFRNDLRRWGFARPIHVETTVVGDEVMESAPAARQLDRSRPFRVLYLSRVEEAKGIFEMLEAFALLESRSPCGYEFTVAGDGPGLEELKDYASALGLKSLSFTGYLDGEEKIRCLQAADAFCFPSYTEGMPNAVLEAMAMGLPVVASAAGGLKDILEDGKCGFVLGYDGHAPRRKRIRPGEVADRIEQLAGDAVVYRSISLYNSRLARDRFAAPMVAGRLEAIYREVIGNGDRGKVMDTHSPCREEKNRLDACEPDSGSQSLTSGCRS